MPEAKNTTEADAKMEKHGSTKGELMKGETGLDASRFPPRFNKILAEETAFLQLSVSSSMYPFAPAHPAALRSDYIQVGLHEYVFIDVDYAIFRHLFGTSDPSKLKKSQLKVWLTSECNVPYSHLEKLSWPDIREFSLRATEAERNATRNRRATAKRKSAKRLTRRGRFTFNGTQVFYSGLSWSEPTGSRWLRLISSPQRSAR